MILETKGFKAAEYGKALKEAFLEYDKSLTQPEVLSKLQMIADSSSGNAETVDEGENIGSLREEAAMPLEQLIARYRRGRVVENTETKAGSSSGEGVSSSSSNAGASCSSSSPKKERKSLEEKYVNGELSLEKKENQVSADNGPTESIEASSSGNSEEKSKNLGT